MRNLVTSEVPKRVRTLAAVLLLTATRAPAAPVDCSDANNLCTGDPCVIQSVEPADPCVVDFGLRAVEIHGLRNVHSVALTAASFSVTGSITGGVGAGGHFSLTATTGGIAVSSPITFVGGSLPMGPGDSAVQLVAAQALTVDAPIRLVRGTTPFASAEDVLLDAGTDLALRAPLTSIDGTDSLTISAGGRIDLLAPLGLRVTAGCCGPQLLIDAGNDAVVGAPIANNWGVTTVQAGALIDVRKPILAGNHLTLDAQNGVASVASLRSNQQCGGLAIHGHGGPVSLTKQIVCAGRFTPGPITITSDVDVTADARIRAKAEVDTGGTVTVTSTGGLVRVSGLVDTRGHNGGDVQVSGGAVQVESPHRHRPGGRRPYAAAGDRR
jgi:hypothetical protein